MNFLSTNAGAALLCCALGAPAMAQVTPFVYSVENSASYGPSIAQGSLFVVYGVNMGPAKLVQANTLPLPAQLGGTSINVAFGSTTIACPMVYSSSGAAA